MALVWAVPFVLLSVGFGRWWLMVLALPLALYLVYLLQGFLLLVAAWWRWHGTPVLGILVLSDSPNWQPYIEENWLPRLKAKTVVLNWSQRKMSATACSFPKRPCIPIAVELLTVFDVAQRLKISERQVWKMKDRGQLPAVTRIGRSVRWRADEVDAWIAAGCPTPEQAKVDSTGGGSSNKNG